MCVCVLFNDFILLNEIQFSISDEFEFRGKNGRKKPIESEVAESGAEGRANRKCKERAIFKWSWATIFLLLTKSASRQHIFM